jgi:hypothetical protein
MSAASRIEAPTNPACFLCRVNHARYSHVVNTKRVRNHDRAPLSITNKSRKCLIVGLPREIRSKSVSSREPLPSPSRTLLAGA